MTHDAKLRHRVDQAVLHIVTSAHGPIEQHSRTVDLVLREVQAERGRVVAWMREQAAKERAIRLAPRLDVGESEVEARTLEMYAEILEEGGSDGG